LSCPHFPHWHSTSFAGNSCILHDLADPYTVSADPSLPTFSPLDKITWRMFQCGCHEVKDATFQADQDDLGPSEALFW